MLLTRIRENREHFHMLCSPGGAFHGALTPKISTLATPHQPMRGTPKQTTNTSHRELHAVGDQSQAGLDALLQAMGHDNNSAPSTPTGRSETPELGETRIRSRSLLVSHNGASLQRTKSMEARALREKMISLEKDTCG